jgi:hypothetical protein
MMLNWVPIQLAQINLLTNIFQTRIIVGCIIGRKPTSLQDPHISELEIIQLFGQ